MRIGKLEIFRDPSLTIMIRELMKLEWQTYQEKPQWGSFKKILKFSWLYSKAFANSWHCELNSS